MGNCCTKEDTTQFDRIALPLAPGGEANKLKPTRPELVGLGSGTNGTEPNTNSQTQSGNEQSQIPMGNITFSQEHHQEITKSKIGDSKQSLFVEAVVANKLTNASKKALTFHIKPRSIENYPELAEHWHNEVLLLKNVKTGDTYRGGVQKGVPHGWGIYITPQGHAIEGFFLKGLPHSHLIQILADGTIYDGGFKNNKSNGKGTMIRADGTQIQCDNWVDGKPRGPYKEFDPSGNLRFSGRQSDQGIEGPCSLYLKTFNMQAEFQQGKPVGPVSKNYFSGKSYLGEVNRYFQEHGKGKMIFVDGRIFEGHFKEGVPHGEGVLTSDTGVKSNQLFINGQIQ